MRAGTFASVGDLDGRIPVPRRRRGKRARPRRSAKQRALLFLIWAAAGALGLAIGLRVSEPVLARLRPGLLAVESVAVVGAKHVSADELVRSLGVAAGTPVLSVDAPELRRRVESNPWIAHARVTLLRPGRILVAVEEREPVAVALLGNPPTRFWLDAEGVPFLPVGTDDAAGRIGVVAPAGAEPGRADARLAEGVALAAEIARRRIPGVREVDVANGEATELPALVLESGARVTLGAGDQDAKLARLAALLSARLPEVGAARDIDVRFGDRMVLRGGPPSQGEAGEAGVGGRPPPP